MRVLWMPLRRRGGLGVAEVAVVALLVLALVGRLVTWAYSVFFPPKVEGPWDKVGAAGGQGGVAGLWPRVSSHGAPEESLAPRRMPTS